MTDVLGTLQKLPEMSLALMPSDPLFVILIHRGVPGYSPFRRKETEAEAVSFVNATNKRWGVDGAQAEAMLVGSMFGWHVSGADPDSYPELRGVDPVNPLRKGRAA